MSEMPRAVGRNRAKHLPPNQPSLGPGGAGTGKFCAGWPRHCPPPHAVFRTRCTRAVQRVRSEAHYAAAVPRLARSASGGGPGKTGERAALPHWAEAELGFPHVVRIRTDIFLRRGKCPRCRVRWGETGRSTFRQTNLLLARAARGPGSFARGGRVPVRRRTRRFGHAALPPCSVFAPRRTTRRQCRGLFSFHRAASRAKQGSAPPCFCFARAAAPLPPRRRCAKINRIYPKMRLCRRRRFSWPRPS